MNENLCENLFGDHDNGCPAHTHADRSSPTFDGPVHSHPGYPHHDHAAIDAYMAKEEPKPEPLNPPPIPTWLQLQLMEERAQRDPYE